jgi:hypothetical protein
VKKWYQSWTVWTNIILIALFVVQYAIDQSWMPIWAEGLIVGVVNLLLRIKTGEQITVPFLREEPEKPIS